MSIARAPVVRNSFAWDWRSAWLSAKDIADCPMAAPATADNPAFSNFRRDSPSAQLDPSGAFIDFLLDSDDRRISMRHSVEHIPKWRACCYFRREKRFPCRVYSLFVGEGHELIAEAANG